MAQQEAMEQVKEFLRLVIKYRFWISIGVAALFAFIAYAVGSRPVRAQAEQETSKILSAEKDVKQYTSPTIPTADYKPIVVEKTGIVEKDVNSAWKTLFDRQAPLLTWPDPVKDKFPKWGRKSPEGVDPGKVTFAKVDYVEALPAYVTMVYKCFSPFDWETGEGIVACGGEAALLRAPRFQHEDLPDLGKIWSTQERLWIQRAVLEVIAQVNRNARARDWDGATIKEIEDLEVGTPVAQDQRSLAKGEELKEPDPIVGPGEAAPEADAGAAAATSATMPMGMNGPGGMQQRMMGMSMGMGRRGEMGGGGGMMAPTGPAESVFYVKPADDKGQYKILPILVTVLIDQDHVQDFLVELENSPMSIQVKDIELKRPSSRVTKPEKGVTPYGGFGGEMGGQAMGYGGGMMQMMMRMGRGTVGMGGMAGYGGQMGMMQSQMMMRMRGGMGGMSMMGGMGGMGAGVTPEKKGKDVRNVDKKKQREETEKALAKAKGPSWFDPHYDIIQVTVYGQARFFLPPPEEPAAEPSPGQSPAAPEPGAPPAAAGQPAAGAAGSSTAKPPGSDTSAAEKPAAAPAEAAPKAADAAGKPAAPSPKAETKTDSTPK
jgi:hypothetical protein